MNRGVSLVTGVLLATTAWSSEVRRDSTGSAARWPALEILDANTALNTDAHRLAIIEQGRTVSGTTISDLQNTFTHELGHAVGWLRNHAGPTVVMYPGATAGETSKRALTADDRAGLEVLYPVTPARVERAPVVRPSGCSASGVSLGVGVLAWLLVGVRRRQRAASLVLDVSVGSALGQRGESKLTHLSTPPAL